ncbi:MAG TPA: hypothetical protein VGK73_32795 [Polyangiaceae bacterium]
MTRFLACFLTLFVLSTACTAKRLPPGTPPPEYEQRPVAPWPSAAAPEPVSAPPPEIGAPAATSGGPDAGVDAGESSPAPFPDAALD